MNGFCVFVGVVSILPKRFKRKEFACGKQNLILDGGFDKDYNTRVYLQSLPYGTKNWDEKEHLAIHLHRVIPSAFRRSLHTFDIRCPRQRRPDLWRLEPKRNGLVFGERNVHTLEFDRYRRKRNRRRRGQLHRYRQRGQMFRNHSRQCGKHHLLPIPLGPH